MNTLHSQYRIGFLILLMLFVNVAAYAADPPSRTARISYMGSAISLSPSGQSDWVDAKINRPLTSGDRLWTGQNPKTELQLDTATVHIADQSSVTVFNLSDHMTQFQLAQGTLSVRLWELKSDNTYEIDTPHLALILKKPGEYRITVDAESTTVTVREGQAEISGSSKAYLIEGQQSCRFTGTDLTSSGECPNALPAKDNFDNWSYERQARARNSVSGKYVSRKAIGYEDLDQYGTWRTRSPYGKVWVPSVSQDWSPYSQGQWTWIEPWGWTWVDDEPWGFTPFHYGRWSYFDDSWGWIPGPYDSEPFYAPALAVFLNGLAFNGSYGIGWYPLGYGEFYYPPYSNYSYNYFSNVNVNNTVVNQAAVKRNFKNPHPNANLSNRSARNAIKGMPKSSFIHADPVSKSGRHVSAQAASKANVSSKTDLSPTHRSAWGGAKASGTRPSNATLNRHSIVRNIPSHVSDPSLIHQSKAGNATQNLKERGGQPQAGRGGPGVTTHPSNMHLTPIPVHPHTTMRKPTNIAPTGHPRTTGHVPSTGVHGIRPTTHPATMMHKGAVHPSAVRHVQPVRHYHGHAAPTRQVYHGGYHVRHYVPSHHPAYVPHRGGYYSHTMMRAHPSSAAPHMMMHAAPAAHASHPAIKHH